MKGVVKAIVDLCLAMEIYNYTQDENSLPDKHLKLVLYRENKYITCTYQHDSSTITGKHPDMLGTHPQGV